MAGDIRILVTDPLAEEGINLLQAENHVKVDVRTKIPPEELKGIIGEYDGLVVRSGTQVTKDILASAKKLKVIGRAGAGLDNIDVETASKQGVIVMNAAGGNTISTAEHTMSLILSLARNIPQACASLKGGRWDRSKFMGVELYGKYLGIIGMGKVGSEVAKRAHGFGMRLLVHDPYLSVEKMRELDAQPAADLTEIYRKADYITLHTPLTAETKSLIGAKEIGMMKKGVRLINCARGGIINEKDLIEGIKSGKVAGAALDVFENEPEPDKELVGLPQVIVTPHLGASTEEAQINVSREIAISVRDYLLGKGIRNAVNVPCVDAEVLKSIEPYLTLIERLGTMHAQMAEGHVKTVRIRYVGEMTRIDLAPLTIAFIKGLLTPALQESVNYVNAAMIAKERGIKVIESKATEAEDFANLIVTSVESDKATNEVRGTLFTRTDPRIVRINDFHVEAAPSGPMLLIRNQDRPGMIGQIGTTLGSKGINIGRMTFGRKSQGGEALLVVNVDQPLSQDLLGQISRLPDVLEVRLLKL
ncbi:MAG: phosphoglycerate dehydrogenase [Candidatus Omnitrophica bacterium]|nr:phosphoglycerate dehydrogenase [Candidatus Omnitrophota bacterium]